jgi:hypothetical protein
VREVPKVTIDFGGGRTVTRTVQGNIAFYFCAPDGRVLDIYPGICTPETFLAAARRGLELAEVAAERGHEAAVRAYHERAREGEVILLPQPLRDRMDMSKRIVEDPLKRIFTVGHPLPALQPDRIDVSKKVVEAPIRRSFEADLTKDRVEAPVKTAVLSPEERALLEEDDAINKKERIPAVHAMLAANPSVRPPEIAKALYREVLHCDLDDPYLGLLPKEFNSGAVNPPER